MKDLGNWAFKNQKLIHFLIAVLLIGGCYGYYQMSKLEDPEITVKQASVVTLYPGASAHQVELEVTDVLEESIRSMSDVDEVTSRSLSDMSIIKVELSTLIKNDEVDQCWDLLRRKVFDVQKDLPQGATTSIVLDDYGDVFGMFYALTYKDYTPEEVKKYADLIKKEVLKIDGISKVSIYGELSPCINIELYEDRMANLGVHPSEVLRDLNDQNEAVYSGYYESGQSRLRVSVNNRYKTVEDIGNLLLQGHEDDQLRLKDIANISESYETPVRNEMFYNLNPALGISISALSGTDITKLGEQVEEVMHRLESERLPAGMDLHKVFFQPERVNEALNSFLLNLLSSILIVVFILLIFMGRRSGLILGYNLFIIVLGSLFILSMFNGTLQRVSLASFVLAMGMLVDNAIVILDGIEVDLKRGVPYRDAMVNIGKKTAMPLLGATLIAILAFLPIFMSPDNSGVYVRDLFIVLAVSLLLSWLLSLVAVPIYANKAFKNYQNKSTANHQLYDSKPYHFLAAVLRWVLKYKTVALSIAVGLVLLSLYCYRFMSQGFFPDMDYNQLYIEYKLPEGYNSTRVKSDLDEIANYLLKRKEITNVTTSLGGTPSRYNLVRGIADPSLSYGELIVDYLSSDDLVDTKDEIQNYLNRHYPDAKVNLKRYNLMGQDYPIEVEFRGPDPAILKLLTDSAKQIMEKSPDLYMVTDNWEPKVPSLIVDYSQPAARSIGLSRKDVGVSLMSVTDGIPMGKFYQGKEDKTIFIKCVGQDGKPIQSIDYAPIFGLTPSFNSVDRKKIKKYLTGAISKEDFLSSVLETVPLRQAADAINIKWEEPLVLRSDGERAMKAQCNVVTGVGVENARQTIVDAIEGINLPQGYTMYWKGERSESTDSMHYLFMYYPLAIVLIIAILIGLFKDYKKPLIILLCLPLILIGMVFSILVTGKTFGFVAIVAGLGLVGMLIKNAIVLMDEITIEINSGEEPLKALINSTLSRLRPVALASLTTILGMIPLLNDTLFGSAAVVIMGGLFIGTMIILLFLPLLYAIFFRIKI